jgi:hypothetical protein
MRERVMADIADDLTDAGYEGLAMHMNGECDESDCPYCRDGVGWEEGDE